MRAEVSPLPWAVEAGIAVVAVAGAGYAFNWYRVRRQRRRLRFITHKESRRLQWWRTVFLVAVLGSLVGAAVAFLSGLLLV